MDTEGDADPRTGGQDALRRVVAATARWHRVEHADVVGSTNDLATAALSAGEVPGVVRTAFVQTAGRGRRGRGWVSRPAGASLALTATTAPPGGPPPTLVPLAAGVAVRAAVAGLGVAAELKWPNDVLVGDDKLAGILVESPRPDALAIGIGVNVDWRDPPPSQGVTSLAQHADAPAALDVAARVCRALDEALALLETEPAALLAQWAEATATLRRRVRVELSQGRSVTGTAVRLDEDGALVLRAAAGIEHRVVAGDVVHLRRA